MAGLTTQRCVSFAGVLLAFVLLSAGCASTQPEKFADQVRHWVPLGTAEEQAGRIMARKGFECRKLSKDNPFNPHGVDCIRCDREQVFQHDWSVTLLLEEAKVIGYSAISVDDIASKDQDP
jgi:hypothetical protein